MDWYKQAIGIQLTPFQEKLARIDQILTGKDWETVARKAAQFPYDIEKLITDIYYLSDGGYSRLYWRDNFEDDEYKGRLVLGSESLDETWDNWEKAKPLVTEVEREVNEAINAEDV